MAERADAERFDGKEDNIRIKMHRDGIDPIVFSVKRSTPMKTLMFRFSREVNVQRDGLRFVFDGGRIQDNDTPDSLELEHDDVIDVYQEHSGGR